MPTTEPLTARGRATRDRIVAAAAELVGEQGIGRTSLEDVRTRAKVSQGQLYHYFADRDDLVRAAAVATADAVLEHQAAIMDRLDGWPAIRAWFDCLVEMQVDGGAQGGCPLATLAGYLAESDERARLDLATAFDRWEALLRAGLEEMLARGELVADASPAGLATATMASLQGGLLLTQVRRDPGQLRTALDASWRHLLTFAHAG